MPVNITTISPTSANPGDQITLTGTGFIAGAIVTFAGASSSWTDQSANVVSGTNILTTAPDLGGDAIALQVTVSNPDATVSPPVAFLLNAWPPVELVFPMCGLNALKRFLGLAVEETGADEQFRTLIQIASAQITRYVTYDLRPITITAELYDGDNTARLDLRHMPVTAVTALSIDGQPVDVTEVKVYPEYIAFDSGCGEYNPRLRAGSRIFARGAKNVAVSYTAGFTLLPADLVNACMLQVSFLKNTLGRQGITSETNSVVNSTVQYRDLPIAPAARIAANRYRRAGAKAV